MNQFNTARTCYNHIGGKYGVLFFSYLMRNEYIRYKYKTSFENVHQRLPLTITEQGKLYLAFLNIGIKSCTEGLACLDGTEKQPHLAGKIGDKLLAYLIHKKFVRKCDNSRVLQLTAPAKDILMGLEHPTSKLFLY